MIAVVARSRQEGPSTRVIAVVAAGLVSVLVVLAIHVDLVLSDERQAASHRRDVLAVSRYSDALAPAAQDAGRAVILGIRPDISDFRAGRIAVGVWENDMVVRARQFADARAAFWTVPVPAGLGSARLTFDHAFGVYQLAVWTLWSAGAEQGDDRASLISLGVALGELGDRTFDVGAARLQAARRALGIRVDSRFPDPERPGRGGTTR